MIARHGQGTYLATRLIKAAIDTSEISQRMVAACILGSTLTPILPSGFASMKPISACDIAVDLQCLVHRITMSQVTDTLVIHVE
ncbi:MAG: DUF3089 domain-containing protein [Halioglobus sp.]